MADAFFKSGFPILLDLDTAHYKKSELVKTDLGFIFRPFLNIQKEKRWNLAGMLQLFKTVAAVAA